MKWKAIPKIAVIVMLAIAISSCGKPMFAKKNGCGCPDKKGMVGY